MSWRSNRRVRPRQKSVGRPMRQQQQQQQQSGPITDEQIGMHVRVLRYHEIRLGNIEKQLSDISRKLSNLGKNDKINTPLSSKNNIKAPVEDLKTILSVLAQEVSSSNKMIQKFITGAPVVEQEKTDEKKKTLDNKVDSQPIVNKTETMEWRYAYARLARCGIRPTEERVEAMMETIQEETDSLFSNEKSIEKVVEKNVEEKITNDILSNTKAVVKVKEESEDEANEDEPSETVDISTTKDIGYVPVHVMKKKKKRGRPKKKHNAK